MTGPTPDLEPSPDEPRQPASWGDPAAWLLVLVWAAFAVVMAVVENTVGLPEHGMEIALLAGAIPFLYGFAWAVARSSKPEAGRAEVRRETRRILGWMVGFAVVTGGLAVGMLWLTGELG